MAMSTASFNEAVELLKVLAPMNASAFFRTLSDAGIKRLDSHEGIDWWNASDSQRGQLLAKLREGPAREECRKLLTDFLTLIEPASAVSQGFVEGEFHQTGWFQYYYSEAATIADTLPEADRKNLVDITNALFLQPTLSAPGTPYRQKYKLNQLPDKTLHGVLFELMSLGFSRIPASLDRAIAGSASDIAIIGRMLWSGDAKEVNGTSVRVVKVKAKWRADSRPYEEVRAASGFLTKSKSTRYADMAGISKPWHPLSTSMGNQWMWFRKGQSDNCLYSVVSVGKAGKDWKAYLPYPLIKLSGGKVSSVRGYAGTRKVACYSTRDPQKKEVMLDLAVTSTYLYLFVMPELAIDTGAMQGDDAYPEVGVPAIAMQNVFGAVKMTRYHLGPPDTVDDECGVLCAPEAVGTVRNDENGLTIKCSYGDALFAKMQERFNGAANPAQPVAVSWAASGTGYNLFNLAMKSFAYGKDDQNRPAFYKVVLPLKVQPR